MTVLQKIYFQYEVLSRMLTVLPRKRKNIRLLHFSHAPAADGNFGIKYRFSNALFYKIGEQKLTGRAILVPNTGQQQNLSMTVYGFFRKNEYTLTVTEKDAYLTRVLHRQPAVSTPASIEVDYQLVLAQTA